MFRYDFELDLNTDNTNADIIALIQDGCKVLEFGPANGRMTRYLKESKNCTIDIVEIDQASGEQAAKYANIACLGEDEGNIGNGKWMNILEGNKYDVIVFADVLEHLNDPLDTLKKCSDFLEKDGRVICSVPNIAHASVIIGLLEGKFCYTDVGLLDNTHVHFFTEDSFRETVEKAGYYISYEHSILGKVGTIEQPYTYDMVGRDIKRILQKRTNNEAYQYIFELRRQDNKECDQKVLDLLPPCLGEIKCFVKSKHDSDFCNEKCITKSLYQQNVDVEFDMTQFQDVVAVRIQLLNTNGIVQILELAEYDNGIERNIIDYSTNCMYLNDDTLCSFDDTVDLYIWMKDRTCNSIRVKYNISILNSDTLIELKPYIIEMNNRLNQAQSNIAEFENENIVVKKQKEDLLEELNRNIDEKQKCQNELNVQKQNNQILIEKENILSDEIEKKQQENQYLQDKMQKEKESLLADIQQMQQEREDLWSEIEKIKEEKQSICTELHKMQEENNVLLNDKRLLTEKIQMYKEERELILSKSWRLRKKFGSNEGITNDK